MLIPFRRPNDGLIAYGLAWTISVLDSCCPAWSSVLQHQQVTSYQVYRVRQLDKVAAVRDLSILISAI
jgi:hypothetical protein